MKIAVGEQLQPVYAAFLSSVKGGLDSINTLISDQITGTERMAYIASFFQGAQGKVLRVYLDAQKLARTAIAEHEAAQDRLGEETENTNTSTEGLADTFEKTRMKPSSILRQYIGLERHTPCFTRLKVHQLINLLQQPQLLKNTRKLGKTM